ncbi:hypothetical protein ASPCADRAFT_399843 [Aspergillus carbonarius ITEM 5010]|uniref:Terpene synthase n=1 Tax=Aspergillus carbonarius (strain ITEM 5010) TaxID=602072 RepID=A0A1R3RBY3_ASPC5|nr:hypothetical protein ASPCADRAFT_399843 [Aspergillus carbonarius ITEM 5010]
MEPISETLPHQEFRTRLKGQVVTIPDLYNLFPEWKPKLHDQYETARDNVLNPWLERWVENPHICSKFQRAEFGVFAAIMCADVTFEKLCTVAKYFAWVFFDCGSLTHNPETLKVYRQKSLDYFRYTLCGRGDRPELSGFTAELQKALLCWDEILLQQMLDYVASVDSVDTICQEDQIPSLEVYWQRRERTAAVYPVIGTIPFIYGIDLSRTDQRNEMLMKLWKYTSYLVHITNDMISLRKELKDNQIENLIPILMLNEGLECNEAMQRGFELAESQANGFHEHEDLFRQGRCAASQHTFEVFTKGCKDVVMGLIHWSYSGERYFKKVEIDVEKRVRFRV